ncbi:MAG TPA: CPBP family intramembrane glutamic endopeptidase [Longimicrobiaceae bacterium]|nr:CPBP family intramembrane glutamic endopeptidase [Longimicrobiaceae bacterium]
MAILKHLAVFIGWNIGATVVLFLAPIAVGVPVSVAFTAAVLYFYLLRSPRRRALARIRPLANPMIPWTAAAAVAVVFASWALSTFYVHLVPVPPESFESFAPLLKSPGGRVAVAVLAVVFAPVMEEIFFRGLIQHTLERRWGVGPGIFTAALLFALAHFLPWVLPLHIFLGLAFGYVVYVTRSIWAGMALHAVNNAAALVGFGIEPEAPTMQPTIWHTGLTLGWWESVWWLLVACAALVFVARGLRRAAREARLRPTGARG